MRTGWRNLFSNTKSEVNSGVDEKINKFVESIKKQFSSVLMSKKGPIKNFKVHLELKEDAKPKLIKAATPPYVVKDEIERQIRDLEKAGVLEYVSDSE